MQNKWKKLVTAVVAVVVLVVAGSFIYTKFINDPPAKLTEQDLDAALTGTTPTAAAANTTAGTTAGTTAEPVVTAADTPAAEGADGTWNVTTASELRYRVKETINSFATEGVGSTNAITGALTIVGDTASDAAFTVDMTTFTSDESRRDGQFNGRIMQVDQFPTATFTLTAPIDFGAVPADGEKLTASATGDLMLHGVTKSVTFDLTATLSGGKVGVLGSIPVVFADYGIENPSFATIETDDNGLLEFVLVFEKA